MTDPSNVDQAIAAFEHEHIWWDETLRSIGLDRMDEPGFMGEWTARDLVAHLSGWQWKTVASMRTALAGPDLKYPETPWPTKWNNPDWWEEDGDVEAINQWIHEQARSAPIENLIDTSLNQWNDLASIIKGLSLAQMNDPKLFPRLEGEALVDVLQAGTMFGHFNEHRDEDIEPWLAKHGRRT